MLARFSGSVIDSDGRTIDVQPRRQIVAPIVVWVTAGLSAPGVQWASGIAYSPEPTAWHVPGGGWRCTVCALAVEYGIAAAVATVADTPRAARA